MINETIMTEALSGGYVPAYFLYLAVAVCFIAFLTITYLYKSNKTNWGNFFSVYIFSGIIIAILLTFLITTPEFFIENISKLWSFFGS